MKASLEVRLASERCSEDRSVHAESTFGKFPANSCHNRPEKSASFFTKRVRDSPGMTQPGIVCYSMHISIQQ